jgi:hypothetical protein
MKKQYVILLVVVVVVIVGIVVLSGRGATGPQNPTGPANATSTPAESVAPIVLSTPEKTNAEVGPDEPRIFMLEPQDGARTESPFYLRVGTANLKVPLLSAIVHVNINAPCLPAGQTIPEDAQHVSLPGGQWGEPRFTLPAGKLRLCIQVSDSQNVALEGPGLTRIIDVEILPTTPASND